jgi:hypothetical protein
VALVVGTIELGGLIATKLNAQGSFWNWLNVNAVGFIIVGMFVLTWAVALAIWHFGRIEERWTLPDLEAEPPRRRALPVGERPPVRPPQALERRVQLLLGARELTGLGRGRDRGGGWLGLPLRRRLPWQRSAP